MYCSPAKPAELGKPGEPAKVGQPGRVYVYVYIYIYIYNLSFSFSLSLYIYIYMIMCRSRGRSRRKSAGRAPGRVGSSSCSLEAPFAKAPSICTLNEVIHLTYACMHAGTVQYGAVWCRYG